MGALKCWNGGRLSNVSIRRKLTLIIMLTSVIALLLASIAFVTFDWITHRNDVVRELSVIAEMTGSNSTGALVFDDKRAAEEILAALQAKPEIKFARLYDKTGRVFAQYPPNPRIAVPSASASQEEQKMR